MPNFRENEIEKNKIWGILTTDPERVTFRENQNYKKDEKYLSKICNQIFLDNQKLPYWICEECPASSSRIIYANKDSQKQALISHVQKIHRGKIRQS